MPPNDRPDENRIDPGFQARRRFVSGKNLLNWWRDWGREQLATPPNLSAPKQTSVSPTASRPGLLSHLTKTGMACQWDVYLNHGQYPIGMELGLNALEEIETWEQRFSFFRSDSEVSVINQQAGSQAVEVSDDLWNVLQMSRDLWELTDGAFDITSSSLSQCWGFLKREGRMPDDQEIAASLQSVGMDKLILNEDQQTIQFSVPEMSINLGSIGKGWTLDRLGKKLVDGQVNDFVFHGGQSSVLAVGSLTRPEDQQHAVNVRRSQPPENQDANAAQIANSDPAKGPSSGWDIGISHPLFADRQLGLIRLSNQALGTSGSARQFFHYRGQRLSHILDPRTGRPAQGVLSVTVLAPTAAQADALGTACFVLGPSGCEKLVKQLPELAILLVVPDSRGGKVMTLGTMDQYWKPHK